MPTQCYTCRAGICDDMASSQLYCGYHRDLENLTHHGPVQKSPSFYETRRFVIVFTTTEHFSLSWARRTQLTLPHPIFLKIYFNIILPYALGSSKWSLFRTVCMHWYILSHACHNPHPTQISRNYNPNIFWVKIVGFPHCVIFWKLLKKTAPYRRLPPAYFLLLTRQTNFHTHVKQARFCIQQNST